jgi:two-component system cell cycle response regulator
VTERGRGARILVVEDTPHSLQLITYLLTAFHHTVDAAITGEQGLEIAAAARPDLVIMDLQLPGIDGFETLTALRSLPGCSAVPVIAVTSFAMVGDRDRALNAGFDHYLTKPINPETFPAEIDMRLSHRLRGTHPEQSCAETAAAPEPAPAATGTHGADILVLDDSPINQTLLRSMLEPHGYRVRTASTVEEAITSVDADRPDLVLSDVHVGRQSGTALLSHLRAVPVLTVVPFAFLSATIDWQDPIFGDGRAPFIRRPIEPSALLDEVRALLAGGTGR